MKKREVVLIIAIIIIFLAIILILGMYIFQKPVVEFSKDIIKVEANFNVEYEIPKVTYHGKDISEYIKVIKGVDSSKLGTYEVVYQLKYKYIKREYTKTYEVVDTNGPKITLNGGDFVKISYKENYEELGYTAVDNYDGDITNKVSVQKSSVNDTTDKYIYISIDTSGNQTIVERIVEKVDDIPPVIQLNTNSDIIFIKQGQTYKEQGATATDEVDGDLTSMIEIRGNVDTSKPGDYIISYQVKDKSGNIAQKDLTVTVLSNTATDTGNTNAGTAGTIYLTFDDGPSNDITPKLLDILKAKNVKATFFIVNYDSNKEYLIKRMAAEGHTIAIHGYSHDYKKIYASEDAYINNLEQLRQKIKNSTGVDTYISRFPGGSSNTVSSFNKGIMTRLTRLVVGKGYRYFDWNVSSGDAGGTTSKDGVYKNVINGLRKNRANVVLMHDKAGNTYTLNAISDIIDYGRTNGYSFEKITMSTPMVTHHVAN